MAYKIINNKDSKTYKIANAWTTSLNPLRGLTQTGINQLIEQVKRGNDVKLQIAFKEIERNTPIFGICINKRLAGITSRKWDIVPLEDSDAAKAQADQVKRMFLKSDMRNLDGLTECLRHLGMASFRGRSIVKPFINDDNELYFKKIDNWNVLEWNGKLYWNPEANQGISFLDNNIDLKLIPDDEVVWVSEERPIDIPGLSLYLRQLIGEENWARATEKYGVSQVIITAPEGTPDSALDLWNSRAISIFEGGSGVLPPGANVNQLTDARGQDPFTSYIEHQLEMIVLLACGEKMTTLGGATGLGSNLADVQSKEFDNLVNYDCKRIANSMTHCAVKKCVEKLFPGKDVLCRFEFVEDEDIDVNEYLDYAAKIQALGGTIDMQKLKDLIKIDILSDDIKDVWKPTETE